VNVWRPLLLCALVGCEASAPAGASRSPIVGGHPAPGDVAVFFLDNDAGVCSATLIAPRTLLTASHCVEDGVPTSATNAPRVGPDGGFTIVEHLTFGEASDGGTIDLALLLLDRAPGVTPMPWAWWGPAPMQDSPIRLVGYGRTETEPAGERRSVATEVRSAVENRLRGMVVVSGNFGLGLCFGDSGGAALAPTKAGERLIAVHSFINERCGEGVSSSVLVYPYRRFIEGWLATHEPPDCARDGRCVSGCPLEDPDCRCGADGVCLAGCPELDDPDCPGECSVDGLCSASGLCPSADLDCIAEGAPCLNAAQCAGRACVSDPQNPTKYCSRPCPAQACPDTMMCDSSRAVCILKPLPMAAEGALCGPTVKCATGTACVEAVGELRCRRTCTSQAQCLQGTACRFGSMSVCVPLARLDAGATWEGPAARVGCAASALWPCSALAGWWLLRRRRRTQNRQA